MIFIHNKVALHKMTIANIFPDNIILNTYYYVHRDGNYKILCHLGLLNFSVTVIVIRLL